MDVDGLRTVDRRPVGDDPVHVVQRLVLDHDLVRARLHAFHVRFVIHIEPRGVV